MRVFIFEGEVITHEMIIPSNNDVIEEMGTDGVISMFVDAARRSVDITKIVIAMEKPL